MLRFVQIALVVIQIHRPVNVVISIVMAIECIVIPKVLLVCQLVLVEPMSITCFNVNIALSKDIIAREGPL
jgi:hypothetical protein